MRIPEWVESLLRPAALLAVLLVPVHALAGVHIEQFGYFKFVGPGVGTTFIDTFDDGGPLINPAGTFEWQVRVGTVRDEDEDSY